MAQVDLDVPTVADEPESRPGGIPLYVWVILAALLAVPFGLYVPPRFDVNLFNHFELLGKLLAVVGLRAPTGVALVEVPPLLDALPTVIIRALTALATPLVVMAILNALITNDIRGRQGLRMMVYYGINTVVAIVIGLALANLIRPGVGVDLGGIKSTGTLPPPTGITDLLFELVPKSIGDSFVRNHLAQLVVVTLALGIGLARIRDEQRAKGETSYLVMIDFVSVGFELLMRVLLWVVALVPLAVFGVVANRIMVNGLGIFKSLGWYIVVVLVGLICQVVWYLAQLLVFARMSPVRFLRGVSNVMATSFSTASTGATMPVTLRALQGPLGVSRGSSQLAACVGTNFNNDGTALYQAAVVLFIAQTLGRDLSAMDQVVIVLTTVVASIGAGCIPSGGFITLPLIFAAVGLPPERLPIILVVDWFLDRCRTSSNILGDMTVAILLDQTAPAETEKPMAEALA